jgi:hypothetical protein
MSPRSMPFVAVIGRGRRGAAVRRRLSHGRTAIRANLVIPPHDEIRVSVPVMERFPRPGGAAEGAGGRNQDPWRLERTSLGGNGRRRLSVRDPPARCGKGWDRDELASRVVVCSRVLVAMRLRRPRRSDASPWRCVNGQNREWAVVQDVVADTAKQDWAGLATPSRASR